MSKKCIQSTKKKNPRKQVNKKQKQTTLKSLIDYNVAEYKKLIDMISDFILQLVILSFAVFAKRMSAIL